MRDLTTIKRTNADRVICAREEPLEVLRRKAIALIQMDLDIVENGGTVYAADLKNSILCLEEA